MLLDDRPPPPVVSAAARRWAPVAWFVLAIGVPGLVWVVFEVDLSYAFVVATAGMHEVAAGLQRRWHDVVLVVRPVLVTAGVWAAGLVIGRVAIAAEAALVAMVWRRHRPSASVSTTASNMAVSGAASATSEDRNVR
jgi:hypothetical protein